MLGNISNVVGISDVFKGIGSLVKTDEDDESDDKDVFKRRNVEKEDNSMAFLRMYDSLFKLLQKCSNKTYT
jgi:hypothetical protein